MIWCSGRLQSRSTTHNHSLLERKYTNSLYIWSFFLWRRRISNWKSRPSTRSKWLHRTCLPFSKRLVEWTGEKRSIKMGCDIYLKLQSKYITLLESRRHSRNRGQSWTQLTCATASKRRRVALSSRVQYPWEGSSSRLLIGYTEEPSGTINVRNNTECMRVFLHEVKLSRGS